MRQSGFVAFDHCHFATKMGQPLETWIFLDHHGQKPEGDIYNRFFAHNQTTLVKDPMPHANYDGFDLGLKINMANINTRRPLIHIHGHNEYVIYLIKGNIHEKYTKNTLLKL